MIQPFDPRRNYEETREATGYVERRHATQDDYDRIGFMSGLEVHQQLNTKEKLFCRCPSGIYQAPDDYDAELIRHMRPTLSELGEYDGTALMEFKTRKQIVYKIKNETACTYDVDDTPPFPLNREALETAIGISLLSKLKIVGEVHITRKQYLDGSIPTGFQRTAIIGVEGEIQLRKKKIRLIQLSLEEDSCREVSDVGHVRVYRTDRLGMPLIETVTYPDFVNPGEVKEGADYIRFLNRSTGKVRKGIGSTRADVNVSCKGGTRVEIKGVAHTRWMPELTHNEAFRQWALLKIRDRLNEQVPDPSGWNLSYKEVRYKDFKFGSIIPEERSKSERICLVNLPGFRGILSHFTQPGQLFADEISGRLKVVACIEKPHMIHSEMIMDVFGEKNWKKIRMLLSSSEEDAQLVFWGPEEDIKTAVETIDERCKMAFSGVPNETRKALADGTTIFERVLPGADRMYPDTDSAPIPLEDDVINRLSQDLPLLVSDRLSQLAEWAVPEDCHTFILKNNLVPLIERMQAELRLSPRYSATFLAHSYNRVRKKCHRKNGYDPMKIFDLFRFLLDRKMDVAIAKRMMTVLCEYPSMDFESILTTIGFRPYSREEITGKLPFLINKFREVGRSRRDGAAQRWIMGNLHGIALGNIPLAELSSEIKF